jgi:hypothetical protein
MKRRPYGTPVILGWPAFPTLKRGANKRCAYGAGNKRCAYGARNKHRALGAGNKACASGARNKRWGFGAGVVEVPERN